MDLRDQAALRARVLREFVPSSPEALAKVVSPMQQATAAQLAGHPSSDSFTFPNFKPSSPEELAKVVPPMVPWAPTLARR